MKNSSDLGERIERHRHADRRHRIPGAGGIDPPVAGFHDGAALARTAPPLKGRNSGHARWACAQAVRQTTPFGINRGICIQLGRGSYGNREGRRGERGA